jgi:FecR protein
MGRDDLALVSLGMVMAVASLALAFVPPSAGSQVPDAAALGTVLEQSGEVQRRPADTLGWRRLARGMSLLDGDAVFVPPGGEVSIRFDDGTELAIDERSLVVLERPRAGLRTLQLRQGAVSSRVGTVALRLQTPRGAARLDAGTEARVELSAATVQVAVQHGEASVAGLTGPAQTVSAGERVEATSAAVQVLPSWPVQLVAPDPRRHLSFTDRPGPLELEWTGELPRGARLQLARDRFFAFVDSDEAVSGGRFALEHPQAGVTWWRLVDARGEALCEARRFVLVEDVAPVPVLPRPGEVVMAPPGAAVPFAWTALTGVGRYRLEVAATESFEAVAWAQEVAGPEVRVAPGLAEGSWYWRVRASDGADPGLASRPSRFRIIHRGIPEAPELYTPEIEIQR